MRRLEGTRGVPPGDDRPQVTTDAELVELWLRTRSPRRRADDRANVARFLAFVGTPLRQVTLGDVERFDDSLEGLTPSPRAHALTTITSLILFGRRVGYLPARDRGRPLGRRGGAP